MKPISYISNADPAWIDSLYKEYHSNPGSVDYEWKKFFEGFDFGVKGLSENGFTSFSPKEFQVWALIDAYRKKAHLLSDTNPVRPRKNRHANLDLHWFNLDDDDLGHTFAAGEAIGMAGATLAEIIEHLKKAYVGTIGFQYMYITDPEERDFLQQKIERDWVNKNYGVEKKKRILQKLNESAVFEKFLATKYIGQKRFSLEGGETTIPALDAIINKGAEMGAKEMVIAMAHRGRLNVLVNIIGKTYEQVFSEFEGHLPTDLTMGDGDVKYHMGFSSEVETPTGQKVYVRVNFNPSHLEAVTPVVEGFVRAKADLLYHNNPDQIIPIVLHGDAAIAGQGVVYEVVQMSQLPGFHTGGTIHFVINNQIGFTTDFDDARSSHYSTSIASTIQAPVFHVNGDQPEAVVWAVETATEYRQRFHKDVFVDMVCYRKHGHNEGDDPKYTQPKLYELISRHKPIREIYAERLSASGDIGADLAKHMDKEFWKLLQDRLDMVKEHPLPYTFQEPELAWKAMRKATATDFDESPQTAVTQEAIDTAVQGLIKVPEGFKPLKKVQNMLLDRREMFFTQKQLDWASAELLAYGTLLLDGHDVRISGQDTIRGTFSHRHAILYDEETNEPYNRLNHLVPAQATRFRIYNSLLSEFGVLGFEYGYSSASPQALVIWEAQFGDFTNGAQTIIDQFITAAETKWQRLSGLVLLLPLGYEGQGPDHSSARLERFLQNCAEFNMAVVNITTPANFFHALRRQLAWPFRKPLVVMSPKSLLRHPRCVSPLDDLTDSKFREVIVDDFGIKPGDAKRVILCSGKIYYDLLERIEGEKRGDLVLVRLEQLYPLPAKQLDALLTNYPDAERMWVQDEPSNMGAWIYLMSLYKCHDWKVVARKSSASPATGYYKVHEQEQADLINRALA
jgi:2-oxoglutarate dehydrogenase E1 component